MSNVYKSAFTLVEILLWLAVFSVLTTVSVANFRSGTRNDNVRQAANLAAGELRLAQSLTLSGEVRAGAGFPAGGWGVRFDPAQADRIVLFADADGDFAYDAGEESETVFLPSKVTFSAPAALDVVFIPPDGAIYFNAVASPDSKSAVFQAPNAALTKTVTVYRLTGQVRVE